MKQDPSSKNKFSKMPDEESEEDHRGNARASRMNDDMR